MKSVILGMLILALLSCQAQAQSGEYSKGQGYVYVAPGGHLAHGFGGDRTTLQIGGGFERFFTRQLGAAADIGYAGNITPGDKFFKGWGTLSSNFVTRFPAKDRKTRVEGFVTAGYTRVMDDGGHDSNGVNFGGGFNWWFDKRAALRIEARDHIFRPDVTVHLLGFRIGLTFR